MNLRKHQNDLGLIASEILEKRKDNKIKRIFVDATPGAGKSGLPVILALTLLDVIAKRIIWVVPRASLQSQGEKEFTNPFWNSLAKLLGYEKQPYRIRQADNTDDPGRGENGYITTYQSVAARPELHLEEVLRYPTILFLDEIHHVSEKEQAAWHQALAPMVNHAKLVVMVSGTFARGDELPISFVPYLEGKIDRRNTDTTRWINYSRVDALEEGAILPYTITKLGGTSKWEKGGELMEAPISTARKEAGGALHTALRTGYSNDFLTQVYTSWINYKKSIFHHSKFLVVAPDIETAQKYHSYLAKFDKNVLLATSDLPESHQNIEKYKTLSSFNILVTVGMAYEGLDVPAITHIAALTQYRSIPWLTQMMGRCNRIMPGKTGGFVFVPDDKKMNEAVTAIIEEQEAYIKDQQLIESRETRKEGFARQAIIPISSKISASHIQEPVSEAKVNFTPTQKEKELRQQITCYIGQICREYNMRGKNREINAEIKNTFGKSRVIMGITELNQVYGYLKYKWPISA